MCGFPTSCLEIQLLALVGLDVMVPWRWWYFDILGCTLISWYFDSPWRQWYFDTWRYFDCWFHGICRWLWKAAAPWATPQLCQLLLNGRKNRGGEQVYTSFFQLLYFPPHFVAARTIKSEYFEFGKSQGHQGKYVKISFHFDHLRCSHKRFLQHVGKVAHFWHQIES